LKIGFREEGDLIVLLDGAVRVSWGAAWLRRYLTRRREFSSSEYSKTISGIVAGEPPAIDLAAEKRLQECCVALAAKWRGAFGARH